MHLPEAALRGRGLGGLGGALRIGVDLVQRQVPEDEAQPAVEPLAHARDDRLRGRAVRALEVAVHDQLERRVGRTGDVVVGGERRQHGSDPRLTPAVGELELLFALLFGAVLLVRAADLVGLPYPIVLVLGGLGLAFVPGMPEIELDAHVVLLVFIPPLLLSAGWYSSPRELRAESRALGGLALALVLVTTTAVAVAAHEWVDGLPWPAAFMLGAAVAPTDAVAAVATFASVRVPERVRLLVQGESLINDATGLTAFRVALAAAAGGFSAGDALLDFLLAAVGGSIIGVAVGWVILRLIRRQPDVDRLGLPDARRRLRRATSLAEEIDASGILAAAVCGLYSGWHQSEFFDADTRLTASAFWKIMVFGLEAMLFVLLGLQLESVVDEVGEGRAWEFLLIGLGVSALVIAVRSVFALLPLAPGLSRRERIVVGWCGMRGAISLAAALSIPIGTDGREEVIFLTFVVILVTLRRPGPDAAVGDPRAQARGRARVEPGGGDRAPGGRAVRARPARRARGREAHRRGAAAAPARPLPRALPPVRGGDRRREGARRRCRSSGCASARCAAT